MVGPLISYSPYKLSSKIRNLHKNNMIALYVLYGYICLYNNKINARVLIGQSAMVYCAGKPMEKSRVF